MARVGLWIGLVHRLGTLDVSPIMNLRYIKPVMMNRHSSFDGMSSYAEHCRFAPHGCKIIVTALSRMITYKLYISVQDGPFVAISMIQRCRRVILESN